MKIYKLIAENVEDKHPQDNMGITPLHIAVQNGHLDICNYVSEKIVKKEDIHPRLSLKITIVAINTFKEVIELKDSLIKLLEKHCIWIKDACTWTKQ